jgi:hypothetical protein
MGAMAVQCYSSMELKSRSFTSKEPHVAREPQVADPWVSCIYENNCLPSRYNGNTSVRCLGNGSFIPAFRPFVTNHLFISSQCTKFRGKNFFNDKISTIETFFKIIPFSVVLVYHFK